MFINFVGKFKCGEHQADLSYVVCCAVSQRCPGKRMLFHSWKLMHAIRNAATQQLHSVSTLPASAWPDCGGPQPALGSQSLLLVVPEPGCPTPVCTAWYHCCSYSFLVPRKCQQQMFFLRNYCKFQLFRRQWLQMKCQCLDSTCSIASVFSDLFTT